MIDPDLQKFLHSGDPAAGLSPARVQRVQSRVMQALDGLEQDIARPSMPRRAPHGPMMGLRGLAFGLLLCAAGVMTGRLTHPSVQTASAQRQQAQETTVLAMASPWEEWTGE